MNGWRLLGGVLLLATAAGSEPAAGSERRPNILFCMADDWGWPDAGVYGAPGARTPTFDRLAREGVLFEHAYVTAPSCTPSRNSVLTGQYPWRLGEGGNLWSTLAPEHPVFPLLLADAGYHVGHWRKAWGPGDWGALGREKHPCGPEYGGFDEFLEARPSADTPFCFWLGTQDPHRPYEPGSGARRGVDPAGVSVPADLPDHPVVRRDIADYLFEVERFDRDVGAVLARLEALGELDDTLIVMTGDHGMPFPRHKCNLYDSGIRVPLAVRWGARVAEGRRVSDFVSLADLAPTFLAAAGVEVPAVMTGRSVMKVLTAEGSGRIDSGRDHVVAGRERHGQDQEKPNPGGYPQRALRTDKYLYIRNFKPERWPSGCPDPERAFNGRSYGAVDESPTKDFVIQRRDEEGYAKYHRLAFAKRPAEELYVLEDDPDQLVNVADEPEFAAIRDRLAARLMAALEESGDPRVRGEGDVFDSYPYRR